MIGQNILSLRKERKLSQEQVANQIGVSRQTIAKWESGESIPDIQYSSLLAELFEVTLDDLVNKDTDEIVKSMKLPKGKYMFGLATVGEKGQIVIPIEVRNVFHIKTGDKMMVLGDINQGIALLPEQFFIAAIETMNLSK